MSREEQVRSWQYRSGQHLEAALSDLHQRLNGQNGESESFEPDPELTTALDRICTRFELSSFERDLLLLSAGYELEQRFGALERVSPGARSSWRRRS